MCTAAETEHSGYVAVGQPTVFWRNGEWQTYKEGKWVPYFESLRQEAAARQQMIVPEPEPVLVPEEPPVEQPPEFVVPGYGGGYGYYLWDPFFQRRRLEHGRDHRRDQHPKPHSAQSGVPSAGIGKTTIGIGQQSGRLGQTTIGIGQQNTGIGQTTIGIGKPTIGIGQPTATIGRPLFSPAPSAPVTQQPGTERWAWGTSGRR
jgi:hypothetical protein